MRTYDSYKDSGIEWIGDIPRHWNMIRLSNVFRVSSEKNHPNEMNLSVYRDYGVIPTNSRDDNHNKISEDTSQYKLVEVGDFVMNKMKCWMGSIGLSLYRGIVSPSYTVLKIINDSVFPRYYHSLLRSSTYIPEYRRLSYGVRVGQWDLRFEDFREIPVLLPPLSEQEQIVSYLDEKTSLIDEMVEKKKRKIELLKEYRTSLINTVVTKGLNPDVPMKDSGIIWIGDIPSHWECGPMKYVLSKNDGGVWGEDFEETDTKGVYVIRSTEITIDGKWNLDNPMKRKLNENELVKYKLYENDIVITKSSGSPEHIGKSVIVDRDVENMNCCYSNFVQRIRFYSYNSKLYHYILNSMISREQFRYLTQTTTGLGNLNSNTFNELLLPYIPLSEQEQIVSYLDEKTSEIDKTIELENKKIELLKEYRQSLISNIVTGKIKVVSE